MIVFTHKGDFSNTTKFLNKIKNYSFRKKLDAYGLRGVQALSANTPVDTGLTAASWNYDIEVEKDRVSIIWSNSNVNRGVNIAIILQLGHGTRNGGYVVGRDYITPAIQPIFDEIADSAWEEVKAL